MKDEMGHPHKIYVYLDHKGRPSDQDPYLEAVRDSEIEELPDGVMVGVYTLREVKKLVVTRKLK